jgi:hypothetical protein
MSDVLKGRGRGIERIPLVERFWSYVKKTDSCWLWTGLTDKDGYGRIFNLALRRSERAPRTAYRLTYGQIPEGLLVCHHCDNPRCVRPDHLFLGTWRDNLMDAMSKGRKHQPILYGEQSSSHRLTWALIDEIRQKYKNGVTQPELAIMYSIKSVGNVSLIVNNKLWPEEKRPVLGP